MEVYIVFTEKMPELNLAHAFFHRKPFALQVARYVKDAGGKVLLSEKATFGVLIETMDKLCNRDGLVELQCSMVAEKGNGQVKLLDAESLTILWDLRESAGVVLNASSRSETVDPEKVTLKGVARKVEITIHTFVRDGNDHYYQIGDVDKERFRHRTVLIPGPSRFFGNSEDSEENYRKLLIAGFPDFLVKDLRDYYY